MAKNNNLTELDGFHYLVKGRHGHFVANRNDIYVGGALITYGEFSELETEFFREQVDKNTTVIEIGANIGAHTVWMAKNAKRVIAVEPQPFLFYTLCAQVVLNSLQNVHCVMAGVSDKRGIMMVPRMDYSKENNYGGIELHTPIPNVPADEVPLITLDSLYEQYNIEGRVFLKIDVEGMELEVLKGGTKSIMDNRPVMYIENDRQEKSAALMNYIKELKYVTNRHQPALFNPNNFFKKKDNKWGRNIVSMNEICIPFPTNPV